LSDTRHRLASPTGVRQRGSHPTPCNPCGAIAGRVATIALNTATPHRRLATPKARGARSQRPMSDASPSSAHLAPASAARAKLVPCEGGDRRPRSQLHRSVAPIGCGPGELIKPCAAARDRLYQPARNYGTPHDCRRGTRDPFRVTGDAAWSPSDGDPTRPARPARLGCHRRQPAASQRTFEPWLPAHGSLLTPRWREMDSNVRSPGTGHKGRLPSKGRQWPASRGSHKTLRWRERDSNPRSRLRNRVLSPPRPSASPSPEQPVMGLWLSCRRFAPPLSQRRLANSRMMSRVPEGDRLRHTAPSQE
jgi:hypothetical protein